MTADPTASPAPRGQRLAMALVLVALTVAAYAPTLGHGFVWDDHEQVVDNPYLRQWSSFGAFWQRDVLSLSRADGERSNYYRPLFFSQYLLYYQLFGAQPAAWHALAILHHLLAAFAAWFCARRLGFGTPVAALAALLFSLHPAHGESVSWVAAAFNDPPAATLILLGLGLHASWLGDGRRRHLALAVAAYGGALMIKESSLAMVPLVALVACYRLRGGWTWRHLAGPATLWTAFGALFLIELAAPWPLLLRHPWTVTVVELLALALAAGLGRALARATDAGRRLLDGHLPYLALTVVYLGLRKATIGTGFGVYTADGPGLVSYLATVPSLLACYLRLAVWPWGYAPSYPLRYAPGPSALTALTVLALIALALAVAWLARRRPAVWLGALWLLAGLAPALNVRAFRAAYLVHQRYLYLAVFGLVLPLAWWLLRQRPGVRRPLVALLVATWGASLLVHNRAWADDDALWTRIAAVDPGNPAAFDFLGSRALEAGRVDQAEALFRRAIAADPSAPIGYRNLAVLLHQQRGDPAAALAPYAQALARFEAGLPRRAAEYRAARLGYGVCLAAVGRAEEALALFTAIAEAPPYPVDAVRNAAVLLRRAGRIEQLVALLERALARHGEERTLLTMLRDVRRLTGPPQAVAQLEARLRRLSAGGGS